MSDPARRLPRYSYTANWKPSEDDLRRSSDPLADDVLLRAASVIPFLMVAAFGVIALAGWIVVVTLGISAPGDPRTLPIWRWGQGQSASQVLWQLALAVAVGLVPAAVVVAAGWATLHGFRRLPHPVFWPAATAWWTMVAVALVAAEVARRRFVRQDLSLGTMDWWFLFGLVAAAIALAVARIRRLRVSGGE